MRNKRKVSIVSIENFVFLLLGVAIAGACQWYVGKVCDKHLGDEYVV